MIYKVEKHYLVLIAETMEDASKVTRLSMQLERLGHEIPVMTYTTIEIPLAKVTKYAFQRQTKLVETMVLSGKKIGR